MNSAEGVGVTAVTAVTAVTGTILVAKYTRFFIVSKLSKNEGYGQLRSYAATEKTRHLQVFDSGLRLGYELPEIRPLAEGPAIRFVTGAGRRPTPQPATATHLRVVPRFARLRLDAKAAQCRGYSGLPGYLVEPSIERIGVEVHHVQDAYLIFEDVAARCGQAGFAIRNSRSVKVVVFKLQTFGDVARLGLEHPHSLPQLAASDIRRLAGETRCN